MLVKAADDKTKRLKLLAELQKSDRLDERQKDWLRKELWRFSPGIAGERDAAHYLDMSFSHSKNHAILHDLRLEADDQIAQIDHLIVGRLLYFYLLETKTYNGDLYINEHGEFAVEYSDKRRYGIESPLEQSRRHETVLKKVLERLGISGRIGTQPTFVHVVMVHPKAIIHRPSPKAFDTSMVIKADQFATWHNAYVDRLGVGSMATAMVNTRSRNTVIDWGDQLKGEHRPTNPLEMPDFMKPNMSIKKSVEADWTPVVAGSGSPSPMTGETRSGRLDVVAATSCEICGKRLSARVIEFCTAKATKFGGKLYCYDHQSAVRQEPVSALRALASNRPE